jgi:LmbE family N-acetylglucosaminyl deacetylase
VFSLQNRAVFFAPHPDDETLGCGGTIAQKIIQGYDVSVVFLTDGRNALKEIGISEPSPSQLKEIRKDEAIRAANILGVNQENLFFLEIEDGMLTKNEVKVTEIISRILADLPKEIYVPQEKEYHVDHRETNRLVRTVIRKLCFCPFEYHYAIAWKHPLNLIVRFRPKNLRSSIFAKLMNCNVVRTDISASLPLKKAAIESYESQTGLMSDQQRVPLLKRAFLEDFLGDNEEFFVPKVTRAKRSEVLHIGMR